VKSFIAVIIYITRAAEKMLARRLQSLCNTRGSSGTAC
jgi:pantothenate kinase-related protein Tda10